MNKLILLLFIFILIPSVSAKSMDDSKQIAVDISHASLLIDSGSFIAIMKDSENITINGYKSNIIGSIRFTIDSNDIILLDATSNSLTYNQSGADTHYIYIPLKGKPIVHGGTLVSYTSNLSEISTVGASNIILSWLNAGTGLSLSFILIILVIAGGISLYMALDKRRW